MVIKPLTRNRHRHTKLETSKFMLCDTEGTTHKQHDEWCEPTSQHSIRTQARLTLQNNVPPLQLPLKPNPLYNAYRVTPSDQLHGYKSTHTANGHARLLQRALTRTTCPACTALGPASRLPTATLGCCWPAPHAHTHRRAADRRRRYGRLVALLLLQLSFVRVDALLHVRAEVALVALPQY